jgi:hypothetical protein
MLIVGIGWFIKWTGTQLQEPFVQLFCWPIEPGEARQWRREREREGEGELENKLTTSRGVMLC